MSGIRHIKTTVLSVICAMVALSTYGQSTINTSHKWAWSAGTGWINCRTDATNGAVIGQYYCSGYWYSSTAGWIDLGNGHPSNGVHYATNSASDYGVNHDGKGHLSGYAWCPSCGWINFGWTNNVDAPEAPKVNLKTGTFSGYAWGGSMGWISLTNLSAYLKTDWMSPGVDSNSNGIPDAWELEATGTNVLGLLSPTNDYDHDGVNDYDEYVAGTSPTNPADFFNLFSVSRSGTNLQVAWSSKDTRLYLVEKKNTLLDLNWLDTGLGMFEADSASNTVRLFPLSTQGFYRVRAALPLAP
jgi:hypothetical protein